MARKILRMGIPKGVSFDDLNLKVNSGGCIEFNWAPIVAICKENDISMELFLDANDESLISFILCWYQIHRNNGGAPNKFIEDTLARSQTKKRARRRVLH